MRIRDGSGSRPVEDFCISGVAHIVSITTMFSGQPLVSVCYSSDTKKTIANYRYKKSTELTSILKQLQSQTSIFFCS